MTNTVVSVGLASARVWFAGQLMLGNWVSLIVTVNEQADVLLLASLTVQATVVVPFGKAVPETGMQTGAPRPGQLSETTGAA